jgi:hypothetical protein
LHRQQHRPLLPPFRALPWLGGSRRTVRSDLAQFAKTPEG